MRIGRLLGVLLAIVALAVVACGDDDEGSSGSGGGGGEKPQLTVSAAASLKTAFDRVRQAVLRRRRAVLVRGV